MATSGVYISGLRETTQALERAGVEVADLKEAMGAVAAEGAQVMRGFLPHRSGRLEASTRGNRAKGKAVVMVGGARVPYAGPIVYGWAARGIRSSNAVPKTDQVMDTRGPQLLEAGWAEIVERYGLG